MAHDLLHHESASTAIVLKEILNFVSERIVSARASDASIVDEPSVKTPLVAPPSVAVLLAAVSEIDSDVTNSSGECFLHDPFKYFPLQYIFPNTLLCTKRSLFCSHVVAASQAVKTNAIIEVAVEKPAAATVTAPVAVVLDMAANGDSESLI